MKAIQIIVGGFFLLFVVGVIVDFFDDDADNTSRSETRRAIDGDTLEVDGTRVRLAGIDALEAGQLCIDDDGDKWNCGDWATIVLASLILDDVRCDSRSKNHWGQTVATCYSDWAKDYADGDLSAGMVAVGMAMNDPNNPPDYSEAEAEARAARRGMWRGRTVTPWDWRRGASLQ